MTHFDRCLDIDSAATFAVADAGDLTFTNTILNCNTPIVENDEETPDPFSVIQWFEGQAMNYNGVDSMLDGVFLPEGSPYLSGHMCDPDIYASDFIDDVDYVGAFRSRNSAWVWGWTEFNQKRSLASLLPPAAEGGFTRRHAISARPLWYRSRSSTYPTGGGGSPTAPW